MNKHGKLVRNEIPALIEAKGEACTWHTAATDKEFSDKLGLKLLEEVSEFASARTCEELADALEVINALIALHGLDTAIQLDGYSTIRMFSESDFEDKDLEYDLIMELDDLAMAFLTDSSRERLVVLVRRLWEVAGFQGYERDEVERVRLEKLKSHGGFDERIILDES